jgi:hypothetical protein
MDWPRRAPWRTRGAVKHLPSVAFFQEPNLQFLHSSDALIPAKLEAFRRISKDTSKSSLHPGQPGSLKVRPDGTVLDVHHRLSVLLERGEDIQELPREIKRKSYDA